MLLTNLESLLLLTNISNGALTPALVILSTISNGMLLTKPSTNIPPLNACLFIDCEKLEPVCMYGDLVSICPSGSSTHINPPWPCTVMLRKIVASFIKKTSISLLCLGGLYSLLNANTIIFNNPETIVLVPASASCEVVTAISHADAACLELGTLGVPTGVLDAPSSACAIFPISNIAADVIIS